MSKAYQCDRCGELHAGEPKSEYEHHGRGLAYQADVTRGGLCGACSKKLKEFLDNV